MTGAKLPDDASAWLVLADCYVAQAQAEWDAASASAKPSRIALLPTCKYRRGKSMAEITRRKDRLTLADRHIAETEENIAHQATLISCLTAAGRDTSQADDMLRLMGSTLDALREHRRTIIG